MVMLASVSPAKRASLRRTDTRAPVTWRETMKWKYDIIETVILVVVLVWAVSSVIEVSRGTAHVGGCGCIVHVEKGVTDAGASPAQDR